MGFNLLEYYKALNGLSTESQGVWHINTDKRHAYRVSSDFDALDQHNRKINLPPSDAETELINLFSDKLGQKLKNTTITDNGDGTESIDLELEDRIVTVIMDQSGSMTWNDNNNFRHDIVVDLINKIEINYPGDITYNLIEYGADIISVLFFGVIASDSFDPNDVDSLSKMIKADDKANYDGMRIIRNDDHYPTSILDGDLVEDGFISRIKDEGLTEGTTYYYTIYTYDKYLRFSEGIRIKVVPQERIVPRSHSNFRTVVDSGDLTKGIPMIGSGVNRDDNTIGIWHMDEGEGKFLYDFSETSAILEYNKENPIWYEDRFVPAGTSGLFFDGENDRASYEDINNIFPVLKTRDDNKFTFMAWIYPYLINRVQYIFSISSDTEKNIEIYINSSGQITVELNGVVRSFSTALTLYDWQHIAIVYNEADPSSSELIIYINGVGEIFSFNVLGSYSDFSYSSILSVIIGDSNFNSGLYRGKITEVSFHNIDRSSTYINSQLVINPILNENNEQIDTETIGIKDDNGDRLVVFKYDVPRDYNYVGGEVVVVKNEKNIPSWEEDGTVIYQQSDPGDGQFFVSDPDNFALGEKYYYRLFTKNSLGNVSFSTDSPSLEVEIPISNIDDYFLSLDSAINAPQEPDIGQLITAGDKKAYLRWKQINPIDSKISRVKIYYSSSDFPVVNSNGGTNGTLVFTGLVTDEKFVHRGISNDKVAYYTIVNVDKYGRSSNYNDSGVQVEDFLHATVIPISSADESTFPLIEIENINYELVDKNTITVGWDQPQKSVEDIEAFFDQTVYVYGAITDEFGATISEDTSIKVSITSAISREEQASDVFSGGGLIEFNDIDAYDFFVTRTSEGFFKGILRMTANRDIISQIKEATFQIQLKALIPKEGGYIPPNDDSVSTDPITEYVTLIEELVGEEEEEESTSSNFFEYFSKTIQVHYTNPWEIELVNKDNQKVPHRCYCEREDPLSGDKELLVEIESFNGIYMKASAPFVARAKVKYKGEPIESGNVQIAVWDADSENLCQNACSVPPQEHPPPFEGPKLQPSITVSPPDTIMSIIQGTEETGSGELVPISFVDIPIYAPDLPQAVRLFVKSEKAGYSSIKDIYVLFQSILIIDVVPPPPRRPAIDGRDILEFRSNVFIINPDYPNYQTSSYDASLVIYPDDLTVVQWGLRFVQAEDDAEGSGPRNIYSTDNVPLTNGVYSFTRNGAARNVFLGPIAKGDEKIDETHEIEAIVVYEGLTSVAKQFVNMEYDPQEFDKTSARFLMEIDGGWKGNPPNQTYGGAGWMNSGLPGNLLYTDGIGYKKLKISRDPRIASDDDFLSATCFRTCAALDDNELLELNSGQVVEIIAGRDTIEILHGKISEIEDPYTGEHYLEVDKQNGFVDNGSAFIELNDESTSDITYFYIRANEFIPNAKRVPNELCDFPEEIIINDCTCLGAGSGITECDLPEWSHMINISGKTTVFVNNKPLVLTGGGDITNGIPPCPIGLNEPLKIHVKWMKVTDYYFNETFGDPENDFLVPVVTDVENNHFKDSNDETLINHNSDIDIRIKVSWRRDVVPDGTPIFTSVGSNNATSLFVANQNIYYTQTEEVEGYSYVDVRISPRRTVEKTTTEEVELFSTYDENGKTARHVGEFFFLTLDKKEDRGVPTLPDDPSLGIIFPEKPTTPYSGTVDRYDISKNIWELMASMSEPRGNAFSGQVGNSIYYMGGLKSNSLSISNRNEQYDISNNTWSDATIMSQGRFGGMSVTVGDDIYLIGGIAADDNIGGELGVTTLVEVYHTDTDLFEELSSLPTADEGTAFEDLLGVAFGTAIYVEIFDGSNVNDYIYVLSGVKDIIANSEQFEIREYNQRILRYSIKDDIWEYSNVLRSNELNSYELISPLSVAFDNKIIVFNGAVESEGQFVYPSEDYYINMEASFNEPSSGEWINFGSGFMGDFPIPKFQSAIVKHDVNPSGNFVDYYVLGGFNDDSPSLDILEKISTQDNDSIFDYQSSSEVINPSLDLAPLPTGKHGASAEIAIVGGDSFIYLMGGYTVNKEDNYVDISFDI